MLGAAMHGIQRRRDRLELVEQLVRPTAPAPPRRSPRSRRNPGSRPRVGRAVLVARERGDLARRVGRAVASRQCSRNTSRNRIVARRCRPARTDRGPCSAPRCTRRRARAARATAARRGGSRASGGSCRRTRSRSAAAWSTSWLYRRRRCACRSPRRAGTVRERVLQRRGVAVEAVVADREPRLRVALVAEPPHAQRRGMRQAQRVVASGCRPLAIRRRSSCTRRATRRTGAAAGRSGAGNCASARSSRRCRCRATTSCSGCRRSSACGGHSGAPGPCDRRSSPVRRSRCRSGRSGWCRRPAARTACSRPTASRRRSRKRVDDWWICVNSSQDAGHVRVDAGDQLELRLAEIGGDVRVRQRRSERRGMRRQRERAVRPRAQALLLDAAAHAAQLFRRKRVQGVKNALLVASHRKPEQGGAISPRRQRTVAAISAHHKDRIPVGKCFSAEAHLHPHTRCRRQCMVLALGCAEARAARSRGCPRLAPGGR